MSTDAKKKALTNTLDKPINLSLTLGMIRIWVGAMSLKTRTC